MAMTALLAVTRRLQTRRRRERRSVLGEAAAIPACEATLPSPEGADALDRLRGRIRGAGRGVLTIRYLLPALAGAGIIGVLNGWWLGAFGVPVYLAAGLLVGLPLSVPLALLYRRLRSRSLHRQLAVIPLPQRLAILAALDDPEIPGTREIVRPLLRDLGVATELAPATVAEGRGDEPAA
jgi:hypothetical protein